MDHLPQGDAGSVPQSEELKQGELPRSDDARMWWAT